MLAEFNVCIRTKYGEYIWTSDQYADLSVMIYRNISVIFLIISKGNKELLI